MNLNTFLLEDYLGKYEFKARYMLSGSDPESWTLRDLLAMATPEEKQSWEDQHFGYTQVPGAPYLRETIKQALYPTLTADNIFCFAGAEEGIFCTLLTLCSPGEHVIALTPAYQSFIEVPKFAGAMVTTVPLKEENGWRIDIDAIKQQIRPTTKVVVINFPHNPTGQIITQEELNELIHLLDKHGIWLFSDEVYYGMSGNDLSWAPPAALLYERAISLGVMSKAYGMPGLRIGWIASQNKDVLKKIESLKHYTSICNSGPSELLSSIGLRNKDQLLKQTNLLIKDNLSILDQFIDRYSSIFSWVRPQAGCTGFIFYKKNESIESFCDRLLKQSNTLLLPGSVYGDTSNHFRIGFGRKNMIEGLEKLETFIRQEL